MRGMIFKTHLFVSPENEMQSAFSAIWLRRKPYRFYRNCVLYVGSSLVMSSMAYVRYNLQNPLACFSRKGKENAFPAVWLPRKLTRFCRIVFCYIGLFVGFFVYLVNDICEL